MNATTRAVPAVLLALSACVAPRQSWNEGADITATPQRPTVSSNTATTAAGTVELEGGLFVDPGTFFDTPTTLKYGVKHGSEAFVTLSSYRTAELVGDDGEGLGDVVVGWRQRVTDQEQDRPSLAWTAGVKLPTADEGEGLGSGEWDFFGAAIATFVDETFTGTGYAQLALLGEPDGSGLDHEETFALALDRPVGGGAGVFGELALTLIPERDTEALFTTFGGTWSPTPGLVLDTGFVVGLSDDAPDFAVVIGFTRNLGRIAGWALRVPQHGD